MKPPLREETIADAKEQARDEHAGRETDAASVVVVRDIQTLVQTIRDAAKTGPVELQPPLGVEFLRFGAGQLTRRLLS